MEVFVSVYIKFFFLLAPFFVLSMFLALTKDKTRLERRGVALRVTLAVSVLTVVLFFFGNTLFTLLGITIDSFRIGAGALLFLSAVALVQGRKAEPGESDGDISVVPLAMPITIGPATTGTLLVMGSELPVADRFMGCSALIVAVLCVGVVLFYSHHLERLLGRMGIQILTKITGLVLAAIAAELVFTGIRNFLLV